MKVVAHGPEDICGICKSLIKESFQNKIQMPVCLSVRICLDQDGIWGSIGIAKMSCEVTYISIFHI